jgi:ElaB/YqjD/DUF883 family membrane-anchored ribosome-binding protein
MSITHPFLNSEGVSAPITVVTEASYEESLPEDILRVEEDPTPEIAAVRTQIAETREQLSETIDAIQAKLSPANLIAEAQNSAKAATVEATHALTDKAHQIVETVVDTAKSTAETMSMAVHSASDYLAEKTAPVVHSAKQQWAPAQEAVQKLGVTTKETGETIVDTIRLNPIPTALIALGVGWLLAAPRRQTSPKSSGMPQNQNGSRPGDPTYRPEDTGHGISGAIQCAGDTISGFAGDAKDKVTEFASATTDQITDFAANAKQQAGEMAMTTKEKTQQAVGSLSQWIQDEPLSAGAVALLVGVAVGLSLPRTDQENQWFGPVRDDLAQQATESAQEIAGKVQNVAQQVIGTAKQAIQTAA